jgi:WD40 repeat protein
VFATASFDHTCRVWDLRRPLARGRPIASLGTSSCNVMCTFSPDDSRLLCSGVDTSITQFEVPSWRQTPARFLSRRSTHQDRYRRSMYLGSGHHFATAATEESYLHVMSVEGDNLGKVDFQSLGHHWTSTGIFNPASRGAAVSQAHQTLPSECTYVQSLRPHPVVQGRLGVLLCPPDSDQSCVALVDLDPQALGE